MKGLGILWVIGLLCLTNLSWAQPVAVSSGLDPSKPVGQYIIEKWTADQGLPTNTLSALMQDRDGYLWIATLAGLVRFDGVQFVCFNRENTPDMPLSAVLSVIQSRHGHFWLGSSGKGLLRYEGGRVTAHYTQESGLASNVTDVLLEDREGTLWVGGRDNGLSAISRDGKLLSLRLPYELMNTDITALCEDRNGYIWIGTRGRGIFAYRADKGFTQFTIQEGGLPDNRVTALYCHPGEETIYAGFEQAELAIFQQQQWLRVPISLARPNPNLKSISRIYRDRRGTLWLGTNNGLIRYHNGRFDLISEQEGLSNTLIQDILEDHEGSLWVATWRGGLNRLRDSKFRSLTTQDGLSNNVVNAVCADSLRQGHWIATDMGLNFLAADGKIRLYTRADGLPSNRIRDVIVRQNGQVVACTQEGLGLFEANQWQMLSEKDGLPDNGVRVACEDRDGQLWVGTSNGLARHQGGKRFSLFNRADGMRSTLITSIFQDKDENLWVGTAGGGIAFLRRGTNRFAAYTVKDGLPSDVIFCITQGRDGTIWIGTNQGLARRTPQGQFIQYHTRHGLLQDDVFQVIDDEKGLLWLTCNTGIYHLSVAELMALDVQKGRLTVVSYTKDEGLKASQATPNARPLKEPNGNLWFPMLGGGVAIFPPQIHQQNEQIPNVLIERLVIDGVAQALQNIVTVSPDAHHLDFSFTALSYINPRKVQFRYRLVPFDTDWQELTTQRSARYTRLEPGNYIFKVIASNNDGVWNEKGDSIRLHVQQPFTQTWWFRTLAGLLILTVALTYYRFKINAERKQKMLLERLVQERTFEVTRKSLELAQQREEILAQNENIEQQKEIIEAQNQLLQTVNHDLEQKVTERTEELSQAYLELLIASQELTNKKQELNQIYLDLLKAHRELDDFVYRAAHDIKGPLRRMTGLCMLAKLEVEEPVARDYILRLSENADELDNTLSRLLVADTIKRAELTLTEVSLREVAEQAIQACAQAEGFDQCNIRLNMQAEDLSFRTDAQLLQTILTNLIRNAVDFRVLDDGWQTDIVIEIALTEAANLLVRVTDNGIGILEECAGRIFDMFFRGSERSKGSGLGLYVAQIAAQKLNGQVRLVNLSQNTVFEAEFGPANGSATDQEGTSGGQ